MAEHEEDKVQTYPTTLYFQHTDGRMLSQTFDDAVSYEAARAGGWKGSPADFGVETHPSHPAMVITESPAPSSPASVDLAEVTALLLSLQVRLEEYRASLTSLAEHSTATLGSLGERVTTLEQHVPGVRPPDVARSGRGSSEEGPTSPPTGRR